MEPGTEKTVTLDWTSHHTLVIFREVVPMSVDQGTKTIYVGQSCVFPMYFLSFRENESSSSVGIRTRSAKSITAGVYRNGTSFIDYISASRPSVALKASKTFNEGPLVWYYFYDSEGVPPIDSVITALKMKANAGTRQLMDPPNGATVTLRWISNNGTTATFAVSATLS